MSYYTSVICNNCHVPLRNKKTGYCTKVQGHLDQQGAAVFGCCVKITYDKKQPFTKASKGDICAACRCKSETETAAEECNGQSESLKIKKMRGGKKEHNKGTKD